MFNWIKRPWCKHEYQYIGKKHETQMSGIFIDDTVYSVYKCVKCKKKEYKLIKRY